MKKILVPCMILVLMSSEFFASPLSIDPKGTLDDAFEQFTQGKDFYYNLTLDKALVHFNQARSYYEKNMSALTEGEPLYHTYLYMALCHFSQKNTNLSTQMIKEAFLLNPKRNLDPKIFPPPFITFFEETKKSFSTIKMGKLEINSTPPFVTVYLNGFKMGMTPLIIKEWPEGKVHLKISIDDYQEWYSPITLNPKNKNQIQAELTPLAQPIWITQSSLSQASPQIPSDKTAMQATSQPLPSETQNFLTALNNETESTQGSWTQSIWFWSLAAAIVGGITYGVIQSREKQSAQTPLPSARITANFP